MILKNINTIKRLKRIVKTFSVLLAGIVFISCNSFFEDLNSVQQEKSSDNGTFLSLSFSTRDNARTVYPAPITIDNLSNFILKGALENTPNEVVLAGPYDISSFPSQIPMEAGTWTLTLSANYSGVTFSDTKTITVKEGENNSISFELKGAEVYGGFEITFDLSNTNIKYVKATLQDKEKINAPIIDRIPQNQFTTDKKVILKRDVSDTERHIEAGLYLFTVGFYADENDPTPVNIWENYIAIKEGYTTTASFDMSVNDVYTIMYVDLDGDTPSAEFVSGLLIHTYSARSSFTLPLIKNTTSNYISDSWNDNGTRITKIKAGTTGNKVLTANYLYTIYVSGTGDDTNGDGSFDNPFESIDKACDFIINNPDPDKDVAICIMGDVTGPHTGTNKAMSSIPDTLTTEHAKSILLIGYNGLDSDGIPQDLVNRGLSSGSETGVALAIRTAVPVTIKNLKITRGNNSYTNNSSELTVNKGGGLYVGENAKVSLSDGVLITGNKATNGGGIYNSGTLYIYGTAAIGNKTQTASVYSSPANTSDDGGGIYNSGHLYLGYSNYVTESENTPEEWLGFIQYNYSWRGGAIKNVGSGVMVMNSGTIAYNEAANNSNAFGAGIYNLGSFLMTGGVIELNRTEGSNGGGVYNAKDSSNTGVFTFTGGRIRNNHAVAGYGVDGDGGGVYNNGTMYIYGDAVIGNDSATKMAYGTDYSRNCSNLADGKGGGIYVGNTGKLYMGYSSYTDETENTPEEWRKGIFFNYAGDGGGGLGTNGNSIIVFNSGTIARNNAPKNGRAVYFYSDYFTICGTAAIPAGIGEEKQDFYYYTSDTLHIGSSLNHLINNPIYIIPSHDDGKTKYYTTQPVIDVTTNSGLELSTVNINEKFIIEPLTATANGITTNWIIDETTGKVKQHTANLYVDSTNGSDNNNGLSQSTALASLTAALAKMDDAATEYTVTINGVFSGPQVFDSSITAGSIIIKGKNTSSTSLSCTFDNTSGTGSALTVNTTVPITLDGIKITGGHSTNGGGLFIGEGASIVLQDYTSVTGNTASGAGAGVYISKDASLVMNSSANVKNNTGANYGGGIYVADGGHLKTLAGSTADICNNNANLCGGGVYLENGSIFEQQGAYVRNNSVNAGGLGSGIYVSPTASYRISGGGEVTPPNDVYLKNNVKVVVANGVSGSPNARLTPETYPVGDEELVLLELSPDATSTLRWSSVSGNFEITPQLIGDDEYQYWFIDTENNGKVTKRAGLGLSVTVVTGLNPDIEVTVTKNGSVVQDNTKLSGGVLTFTAPSGYSTYKWVIDEEEQTNTTNAISVDTSTWPVGAYTVYLEAKDANGHYYSYTAQIKISSN